MSFLIWLAIRTVVFGIALTFACKRVVGVKVEPRSALPAVALAFGILNALLYGLLAGAFTAITLFTLGILAPFAANAILLWVTDKLMKPLKIDGFKPLLIASVIVTLAHFLLRLVEMAV